MKYIALLYGEPGAGPVPGTPEFVTMLGEFQSATAKYGSVEVRPVMMMMIGPY